MSDSWGVGDKAGAEPFAQAKVGSTPVGLIFGEYPHSRSNNSVYARFPNGNVEAFDGHRITTRIEIEESNYLKQSELSGDEVRKGGSARIFFNGVQVYEFFTRDAQRALIKAHGLIDKLREHPAMKELLNENVPAGDRLRGRMIYYRGVPAICAYTMPAQGCVMIEPEPGQTFPPMPWNDPGDEYLEDRDVKEDILSPHIWWYRATPAEEAGRE